MGTVSVVIKCFIKSYIWSCEKSFVVFSVHNVSMKPQHKAHKVKPDTHKLIETGIIILSTFMMHCEVTISCYPHQKLALNNLLFVSHLSTVLTNGELNHGEVGRAVAPFNALHSGRVNLQITADFSALDEVLCF